MFVVLYATKAFLPVYALDLGISVALIGVFFAIQEAAHMLVKPLGGRLGDRVGYVGPICAGMIVVAISVPLLSVPHGSRSLLLLAAFIGIGQGLVFPSTVALVSTEIDSSHIGSGMGLIGMLKNSGKVGGPILGGLLIQTLGFGGTLWFMGALLLLGAVLVWFWGQRRSNQFQNGMSIQECSRLERE